MSAQAAKLRYLADRVNTASPAALVVLLYDRLALDIEIATAAQSDGDPIAAAVALSHAQRIVTELLTSLDRSAWVGADDLAALYRYLLMGLIDARTSPETDQLRPLGVIVAQLGSAWRAAEVELAGQQPSGLSRVG